MQLKIDITGLKEAFRPYNQSDVRAAINRSINRAITTGRKAVIEHIRHGKQRPFNITYADMARKITLTHSRLTTLTGIVHLYGHPIVLSYFKPIWVRKTEKGGEVVKIKRTKRGAEKKFKIVITKTQKPSGTGASVEIFRGKRVTIKHTFVSHGKYGNPLVFIKAKYLRGAKRFRVPSDPNKLIALATYKHTSMLRKPEIFSKILQDIQERYHKELVHELQWRLSRKSAKS